MIQYIPNFAVIYVEILYKTEMDIYKMLNENTGMF